MILTMECKVYYNGQRTSTNNNSIGETHLLIMYGVQTLTRHSWIHPIDCWIV